MISSLVKAWTLFWCGLWAPSGPTRVGLLNTGELVLISGHGNAQVFNATTTDLMRDVLDADSCSTTHLLGAPSQTSGPPNGPDRVHKVVAEMRFAP